MEGPGAGHCYKELKWQGEFLGAHLPAKEESVFFRELEKSKKEFIRSVFGSLFEKESKTFKQRAFSFKGNGGIG